jgi:hypothetical protein
VTFRLLFCSPNHNDAPSLYRGVGALAELRRSRTDLEVVTADRAFWSTLAQVDAVYLQRPWTPDHLALIIMARRMGRPVWVDYDDDLLQVPDDNPSFEAYSDPRVRRTVVQIIQSADVVTVSTRALARVFYPIDKREGDLLVIPNALDTTIMGELPLGINPDPIVAWRGTKTHQRDLMSYADPMVQAANTHKDWKWVFLGYRPWFMISRFPDERTGLVQSLDPIEYFALLRKLKPRLVVVPLANNRFNRCKSNIAWIEATLAGAACLAPDWEEWRKPGVITYQDETDFAQKLNGALAGDVPLEECWRLSSEVIDSELRLPAVNTSRGDVINELWLRRQDPQWVARAKERIDAE